MAEEGAIRQIRRAKEPVTNASCGRGADRHFGPPVVPKPGERGFVPAEPHRVEQHIRVDRWMEWERTDAGFQVVAALPPARSSSSMAMLQHEELDSLNRALPLERSPWRGLAFGLQLNLERGRKNAAAADCRSAR